MTGPGNRETPNDCGRETGVWLVKMVTINDAWNGRGQFLDKKFAARDEDHAAEIARRLYPEYTVLAVEAEKA